MNPHDPDAARKVADRGSSLRRGKQVQLDDDPNAKPGNEEVRAEPENGDTALRGASLTVGLLALLYAISLIDRSILAD